MQISSTYLDLIINSTDTALNPPNPSSTLCHTSQWHHAMGHLPKMVPHLLLLQSTAPILPLQPSKATSPHKILATTLLSFKPHHLSHQLLLFLAKMAPSTQSVQRRAWMILLLFPLPEVTGCRQAAHPLCLRNRDLITWRMSLLNLSHYNPSSPAPILAHNLKKL